MINKNINLKKKVVPHEMKTINKKYAECAMLL